MYKIIGGDHKEYGPVSADEIRRWIAEGRLNTQSWARLETSNDWKSLASYPEFAEALGAKVPTSAVAPPLPTAPAAPEVFARQVLAGSGEIDIGDCLSGAFSLLKSNFGLLYAGAFIVSILEFGASLIPLGIGMIFFFLVKGVLYGGFYLLVLKRIRGEPASVGDVFAGFSTNPVQLILTGVVTGILIWIGKSCCCVLPGLYLYVAWIFAIPLVIDRRLEFWSAIELSRKVVTRIWFPVLGLMIVAFLPYVIASVIAQIKLSMFMAPSIRDFIRDAIGSGNIDVQQIMNRITDLEKQVGAEVQAQTRVMNYIQSFVWFLNWPFALAALMYAYESLFSARKCQGA